MEQVRDDRRLDLPPEYCSYGDQGCDLAPSCLNCPFPRCRFDAPGEGMRQVKGKRDRELVRLRRQGAGIADLARRFDVSKRTVHRILKNRNPNI